VKRALVTGAAGFIGSHFADRLMADGWLVDQVDLLFTCGAAGRDCREWFTYNGGERDHYDLAVHCAAVVGGRATIDGSPLDVAVNFELDVAFARWAARTRPDHVVYLSSSAVYPVDLQDPRQMGRDHYALREEDIDLDAIRQPDAIYGLCKLVGETLMCHLERAGVRTHVFRPFSGYGPGQSLDYPFPSFVARALRREDPFVVWGDGQQVRDWIHVDDLVSAVLAAVEQDVRGPLNLGWGRPVSFDDLAALVCAAAGYSPTIQHLEDAPVGVRYRVCDPTRMLEVEVYRPWVTLEEGIRRALAGDRGQPRRPPGR
jgi:nucleoside-diphosphate-sugar epimerase